MNSNPTGLEVAYDQPDFYGPEKVLTVCRLQISPKCHKRHFNDKDACPACIAHQKEIAGRKLVRDKYGLTPMQAEVLKLYAGGVSFKAMPDILKKIDGKTRSVKTFEYHIGQIKRSLKINDIFLLVHFALAADYIPNHYSDNLTSMEVPV